MWVIGTNAEAGGYGIYRWSGKSFQKIPGSGLKISVDGKGNAWIVNKKKEIHAYNGTKWLKQTGAALDIACGGEGTVWTVGTKATKGGHEIYRKSEGPFVTSWATNTQKTLNWKKNVRWEMSF